MPGFLIDHHHQGDILRTGGHADFSVSFMVLGNAPEEHEVIEGLTTFVDHLGNESHHKTKLKHVRNRMLGEPAPSS